MSRIESGFPAFAGAVAIAAGLGRVALSFAPPQDPFWREWIYLLMDAAVLLVTLAFYLPRRRAAGLLGALGFGIACSGGLLILGPEPGLLGANNYAFGTAALVLGWSVLALQSARRRLSRTAAAWLFFAAAICGAAPASSVFPGFMIAGILFGIALVAIGLDLLIPRAKGVVALPQIQ